MIQDDTTKRTSVTLRTAGCAHRLEGEISQFAEDIAPALLICPGFPDSGLSGCYDSLLRMGISSGWACFMHELPGCCPSRRGEDFRSYGECVDEVRDTIGTVSNALFNFDGKSYRSSTVTLVGDGFAARLIIEVLEQYDMRVDHVILINPLLGEAQEQFSDVIGKMGVNLRIAARCGRVPVDYGNSRLFFSDDCIAGLDSSDPMKFFGLINMPVTVFTRPDLDAHAKELMSANRDHVTAYRLPGSEAIEGALPGAWDNLADIVSGIAAGELSPRIQAIGSEEEVPSQAGEKEAELSYEEQEKKDGGISL